MSPAKAPILSGFFAVQPEISAPAALPFDHAFPLPVFTLQKPRSPGKQKSPGVKNPFRAFNTKA